MAATEWSRPLAPPTSRALPGRQPGHLPGGCHRAAALRGPAHHAVPCGGAARPAGASCGLGGRGDALKQHPAAHRQTGARRAGAVCDDKCGAHKTGHQIPMDARSRERGWHEHGPLPFRRPHRKWTPRGHAGALWPPRSCSWRCLSPAPLAELQPNGPLPLLSPTFSGSQTFSGDFTTGDLSGVSGEAFDTALQTDPTSAFYVSVHTQEWSAGALRGQVLPAFVWEAELAAANNVPPLTDQQVAGAKAYFSMIDLGTSYSYELTVEGVQDFTNAHFHWGAANENGPIILNLVPVGQNLSSGTLPTLNPAFSGTATYRGNFTTDDLDGVSPADFKAALRTGPSSQLYIAVHTTEWPGGAIRGQLHWSASPGSDVLSVYNGLSGSAGGGGATSGAARGSGGSGASGLLALTLALAAALALLL
ncbi:hypothetical protein ABPG75_009328 [Micractinium tetrahymenae]